MEEIIIPIITAIVGGLIGGIFTLIVAKRKENREESLRLQKERKEIFDNRPEYKIVDYKEYLNRPGYGIKQQCDIDIFITPIKDIKINGRVDAIYDENSFNKKEWCCVIYELENVGKTDITVTYVICSHKRTKVLFGSSVANKFLEAKCLNYSESCDDKIRVGEKITLKICYHKDCIIASMFDAIVSIGIKDINGRCWEQPLFVPYNKIYDSYLIPYKQFRANILTEDAEECFKQPWLW